MINSYEIKKINNEEILILNFNYNYEFGSFNKNNKGILNQIKEYIKNHKINFKGSKIVLMVTGIIVGTLFINTNFKTYDNFQYNYVDKVILNDYKYDSNKIINKNEIVIEIPSNINDNIKDIEEQHSPIENNNKIENNNTNNESNNKEINNNQPTTPIKTENNKTNDEIEAKNIISIKRSNGITESIEFNEYIIGVIAAEMPASFHIEALKAQAVVARTYYYKNYSKKTVTDNSSFQNYIDINTMKNKWGNDFNIYYNKIKNAVLETNDTYITYNGEYIDAVYFSTSNGYTEDAVNIWGNYIPYLISVDSSYDINTSSYLRETTKSIVEINSILGINMNENSVITIEKNSSNHVSTIYIDSHSFSGKEFREKLNLRSTDFDIIVNDNNLIITTKGYGHGVGMSQYGANEMAKQGYSYQEIIKHYYTGVSLNSLLH